MKTGKRPMAVISFTKQIPGQKKTLDSCGSRAQSVTTFQTESRIQASGPGGGKRPQGCWEVGGGLRSEGS